MAHRFPIDSSAETSSLMDLIVLLTQWEQCILDVVDCLCATEFDSFSFVGGSRARYVDVLNPSGTQRSEPALAPSDFFAPLAPLPILSNLFIPNPGRQPMC